MGSRIGDGQAQGVHGCYRCAGLLLRSTKSLAAWHERKHQSAPATILPARNRPSSHHSSAARPGRAALESTSKKDPGISNSCEYTSSKCCVDRLSWQRLPGTGESFIDQQPSYRITEKFFFQAFLQ